jgi:hypothetical protein
MQLFPAVGAMVKGTKKPLPMLKFTLFPLDGLQVGCKWVINNLASNRWFLLWRINPMGWTRKDDKDIQKAIDRVRGNGNGNGNNNGGDRKQK